MATLDYKGKSYKLDANDFLKSFETWDSDFAEGMAQHLGMQKDLTKEQWDVINYVRDTFKAAGRCPNVYETCRECGLRLREIKRCFPTGYLRGACRLSGVSYKEGFVGRTRTDWPPYGATEDVNVISTNKIYQVDVRGFLNNPDEWDEYWAIHRAFDMKVPGGRLTDKHWQIIRYLREGYEKNREVPTVYETCEENNIELGELETLFPDGYHRGAVRIAGLRAR